MTEFALRIAQKIALFILQLFICEIGFLVGLRRKENFFLRAVCSLILFLALVALSAILRELFPGKESYLIHHLKGSAFFLSIALFNAIALTGCFEVNFRQALFSAIGGYSVEHMASRFSYILRLFFYSQKPVPLLVEYLCFYIGVPTLFSLAVYFFLIRKSFAKNRVCDQDGKVLLVSCANLFICIVISSFEPDHASAESVEAGAALFVSYICSLLSCLLCLCLQAGVFHESKLDAKNRVLSEMLAFERRRQTISKETVEMINLKCHDLRHQIRLLEMQSPELRSKSLKKISDAIHIYDTVTKTGNDSVDLVLMEKSLLCEKNKINFTYMVDGDKFDFMTDEDIYVMLGNMLDNAIECVEKEENVEKRVITLEAHAKADMLYLCMENNCPVPVAFRDGFPETSKSDKLFHGYGVRSIAHIAKSYGGNARFFTEDGKFVVEALFPINKTE